MLAHCSLALILAFAGFLLVQGVLAWLRPHRVRAFLAGFAASPRAHFSEMGVRILLGLAFVAYSPLTLWPQWLRGFGLVLLGTSVVLLFVPWRIHQRFAAWSVPKATRSMPMYGVGCVLAGIGVAYVVSTH